mmetsp:Transcript_16433/g.44594  ORF Transcript_16433/g.44594 Transcript_16433/m.44594 type:complete len:82 (+) Transcript_16433:338-583(+)
MRGVLRATPPAQSSATLSILIWPHAAASEGLVCEAEEHLSEVVDQPRAPLLQPHASKSALLLLRWHVMASRGLVCDVEAHR